MNPDPLVAFEAPLAAGGVPARDLWELAGDAVHLNHGSYGAVPAATTEHQLALIRRMNAAPGRWFTALPTRVAEARHDIAAFLGTDPERTALVPNASAGVSVVLQSLDLPRGAEIVLTDHTYGAVRMAAERAARRAAGTVTEVAVALEATDDDVTDALVGAVSERTALVIVDQISSATARVFPVADIARRLRASGIPVLVDAAHAPGMLAQPAAHAEVDYWIGNLHKWACAPRGTAALVASPRVSDALFPVIDSWGAPHPFPSRFDTQGTVDLTSYLAAPHAFRLLEEEFGWERIREYSTWLVAAAQARVGAALEAAVDASAAVDAAAPAPMMRLVALPPGLVASPGDAHVLSALLARLGFETAITSWGGRGFLRLSAHVYNTLDDYDIFIERGVPVIAAGHAARSADGGTLEHAVAALSPS
jgi:isopenicillin-N epimerase